jgi:hypothetical protein
MYDREGCGRVGPEREKEGIPEKAAFPSQPQIELARGMAGWGKPPLNSCIF